MVHREMRYLKTYKLFENNGLSKNYNIDTIKNLLLDYSDTDIYFNVQEASAIFDSRIIEWLQIDIVNHKAFKIKDCLFEVIDYLEECGLVIMDQSWFWQDDWQHYIGCPNCLIDDIEDKYEWRPKGDPEGGTFKYTSCNRCGYEGEPDSFLLDTWPCDRVDIEKAISEGKLINHIQLNFSDKKSFLYKKDS